VEQSSKPLLREPDERLALLVLAYILFVVGCLGALLTWVFWVRGYA
jgi:hypothetical protein